MYQMKLATWILNGWCLLLRAISAIDCGDKL